MKNILKRVGSALLILSMILTTTIIEVYADSDIQKVSVICYDYFYDNNGNRTLLGTQTAKEYAIGETARGYDWGTTSPYENISLVDDTSIKIEPESISATAFDKSPEAIARYEKVTVFDQDNFTPEEIYNTWDMFPNPNATVVYDNYMLNDMGWTMPAPGGYGRTAHEQAFLYGDSDNHGWIEISADIMNHGCCAPSGLVVNYNTETDTAYVVVVGDAYQYVAYGHEYSYTRLYRVTHFNSYLVDSTNFLGQWNGYSTCVAEVPTRNFDVPQVTYNKVGAYWFTRYGDIFHNMDAIIDEDGHLTISINNINAIEYDLPTTERTGRVGFLFQCIGCAKDVKIIQKSTDMEVINGLCINPNGGKYESYENTTVFLTAKAGSIMKLQTPTRTGYTFAGWSKSNDFGGNISLSDDKYIYQYDDEPNVDVIVARWIPNRVERHFMDNYKVIFNGNGADSGSVETMICEYDKTYNMPSNGFIKKGYLFTGWNTKANGTGTPYKEDDSFINIVDKNTSSIIIYAQWKSIEYDIVFHGTENWNTEQGDYSQHQIYDQLPFDLIPNKYNRNTHSTYDKYTFVGWSETENSWTKNIMTSKA